MSRSDRELLELRVAVAQRGLSRERCRRERLCCPTARTRVRHIVGLFEWVYIVCEARSCCRCRIHNRRGSGRRHGVCYHCLLKLLLLHDSERLFLCVCQLIDLAEGGNLDLGWVARGRLREQGGIVRRAVRRESGALAKRAARSSLSSRLLSCLLRLCILHLLSARSSGSGKICPLFRLGRPLEPSDGSVPSYERVRGLHERFIVVIVTTGPDSLLLMLGCSAGGGTRRRRGRIGMRSASS